MKTEQPKFRRYWRISLAITAVLLWFTAASAFAFFEGKVEHFSADSVTIDPSGKVLHTGKLYVSGDVMRMDGIGGAMGPGRDGKAPDLSMLVLEKEGKMYFYNHDKKLVYEGPVDETDMAPGYKAMDNVESEKIIGKEKVSGYKCVKKELTLNISMMGMNQKDKLTVWESDRFEFPLRTMTDDGSMNEMRNIKEGKPPEKRLRPLTGYKKVGNMMAVMGMDIGSMRERRKDREKERARALPNPASDRGTETPGGNGQNLENMDVNQMMEQMSQAMGDNMSPEEKEQLMQIMANAVNTAKDTREGPGAAEKIWQIIPRRPGDQIGDELKTTNVLNVTMGTKADLSSVFDFYKNKLSAKGWRDQGMYLQNGEGHLSMSKGDRTLTISSASNPGLEGNYTLFYMMQLTGPDI